MTAPAVTIVVAGKAYPPTMSTAETAKLFGCSAERLYAEKGNGGLPVEPLELGRRYRWPTVRVAEALGLPYEIAHGQSSAVGTP